MFFLSVLLFLGFEWTDGTGTRSRRLLFLHIFMIPNTDRRLSLFHESSFETSDAVTVPSLIHSVPTVLHTMGMLRTRVHKIACRIS